MSFLSNHIYSFQLTHYLCKKMKENWTKFLKEKMKISAKKWIPSKKSCNEILNYTRKFGTLRIKHCENFGNRKQKIINWKF